MPKWSIIVARIAVDIAAIVAVIVVIITAITLHLQLSSSRR